MQIAPKQHKKKVAHKPAPTEWDAWLYLAMVRYHMTLDAFLRSAPVLLGRLMHEDMRTLKGAKRRKGEGARGETIQVRYADQLPPGVL